MFFFKKSVLTMFLYSSIINMNYSIYIYIWKSLKLQNLGFCQLCVYPKGRRGIITHSLNKHWLPSSVSQDLQQWLGEMNIAKRAVCKKCQGQAESG